VPNDSGKTERFASSEPSQGTGGGELYRVSMAVQRRLSILSGQTRHFENLEERPCPILVPLPESICNGCPAVCPDRPGFLKTLKSGHALSSFLYLSPTAVQLSRQPAERCSVRQGRFRVAPSHCCTVAPLNQGECAHISLPLNLPSLDLCAHFAGCCKSPRAHPKNVRTFRTRPKVRTNGPALARWRGKKCAHISRERAEREGNVRTFAGSAVQAVRQCNSATVKGFGSPSDAPLTQASDAGSDAKGP